MKIGEFAEAFERIALDESFNGKRSRRVTEAFDYDQAVEYIESRGVGCDPCQSIEGEYVCDLLDELGGDLDSEDYSKEELDYIISSALEFKRDAETWDNDLEESLTEAWGPNHNYLWDMVEDEGIDVLNLVKDLMQLISEEDLKDFLVYNNLAPELEESLKEDYTVWFETPDGDVDIAGTYRDRETAELVAQDIDDAWIEAIDEESLTEGKKDLPIRKVLQNSNIMEIIDRDPRAAIKKAVEIVSNSNEVSDKDKYEFKRNMQGNLNKAVSTLATYFYDVNKANI